MIDKLNYYKPNFISKLFHLQEKDIENPQKEVIEDMKKDEKEYRLWERDISLASRVVDGNIDAYFEVIQEFYPLDDLLEFGS